MSSSFNDPRCWLEFVPGSLKASPLYTALWEGLQKDEEILAVMQLVDSDQPLPITFFTAVNFLVLQEPTHLLALFYASLHPENMVPVSEAYPIFRTFVLAHLKELQTLLPTARLQTNEVTWCSNLLPAFSLVYQRGGEKPLHMLEIGSSAGFNLLWDHYRYFYSHNLTAKEHLLGNRSSPVPIQCLVEGDSFPFLPETFPRVAFCQGIELLPRDVYNDEDMQWLRAAIWPEERSRYQLLDAVIKFVQRTPIRLRKGDASELLPAMLAAISSDRTAIVWHSFAVNQGPIAVKELLEKQIAEASSQRTVYRVSLEVFDQAGPRLDLITYEHGERVSQEHLANCAFHGERMTWLH